jgi:uncharacterized membrane protein YfcA
MSPGEVLGLAVAAAAGGAINAVAGGGTLITFPALLFLGVEPVRANATSTLALVIGTCGSLYGYRQHLEPVRPWLWRFVPVSLAGGLAGSVLLTVTSNATFSRLIPFLILFATLLFLAQGMVKKLVAAEEDRVRGHPGAKWLWGASAFQFAVAIYGGYFGAGIGILMLAALGFLGLGNIYQMNTLKTILGSLINVVAAIWFVAAGLIDWPQAGVMTVGALAGYYLASHYSQKIPQQRVRQIITVIGLVLSAVTFYKEFFK